MPNWVSNHITIYGDNEKIEELMNLLKDGDNLVSFQNINANFVRLDPDETRVERLTDNSLVFEVETAWEKPLQEMLWVTEKFPELMIYMNSGDGNTTWNFMFHDGQMYNR
jgi:hypothetical protein